MSFVLAIGVDFAETRDGHLDESPTIQPPALRDTLRSCERNEPLAIVSSTIGSIEIEDYDVVDAFIRRLTVLCTQYNSKKERAEDRVCYFIAVGWKGAGENGGVALRAQLLLTHMISEDHPRLNLPVTVVVTAKAYAKLLPKFQDTYRSSTEIQDIKVHQRFREGIARCFVVSPIGEEGSATRKRANEVFETYIKPACDPDYQPVRGEMMLGGRITPDMEEALQTSPMVIAYLGSPKSGWNANVMYEYGQRKAFGLPVVVLRDATVDGTRYDMPFDLKDDRCVDLPENTPTEFGDLAPKIRTIRALLRTQDDEKEGWKTIYPSATVDIVISDPSRSKYIEASPGLEELFELNDIKGRALKEVINHLTTKMTPEQDKAFLDDQNRIFGSLVQRSTTTSDISASVPIVFQNHTSLRGRAYLPIIASHSFFQATNTFRLYVVYIEVTLATRRRDNERYYSCSLVGSNLLETEAR